MNLVIIVASYNEAENTKKMIPLLDEEFKKIPNHNIKVLYIDGNSPDGTADVVRGYKKQYPFVDVLVEKEKAGLGAAYVQAFKYVMENYDADAVMEMDADLQHNPADIKKFVEALDNGADYVIGSRFTEGGSIPKDWELYRKIFSIGGNIFSKIVLGIYTVNDFTSGFKATKVKGFLDKLDLDTIKSKGFAYKVDLLFRMHRLGAKIVEVPITFGIRDGGESKMERNNALDTLKVVLSLRLEEHKEFVKFCVVGFAGLGTDVTLFNILRITHLASPQASAISGLIAMMVTFTLNNVWSFKAERKSLESSLKAFPFYAVSSYMPILFRSWLVAYVISHFADTFIVANATFFVGVVIGLLWNYTVYSRIIWKKQHV